MVTKKAMPVSGEPKFVILTNLGPAMEVVVPDDPDRYGREIIISPYDSITIKMTAFKGEWADDVNLASVLASGRVIQTESNTRARGMPQFPDRDVTDPYDKSLCYELVCGTDERFTEILEATLERGNKRSDQIEYMAETYPRLLRIALGWLKKWGPPDELAERVGRLEDKLVKLEAK